MSLPDTDAVARFLAANARVLDWRIFDRLFRGGDSAGVASAVAAYRNADGGFGYALEPDGRAPASQPAAVELGLRILDQTDSWDDELAAGACRWLEANEPSEGGTVFVEPTIAGWPHAPWWQPQPGRPASLTTTGQIAGTLHARKVRHPWLDRASALMWSRIDALTADRSPSVGAYDMYGVLSFLQHAPDRTRAQVAVDRAGSLLFDLGLVTLDPGADGEVHSPLGFAPAPNSLARGLFDAETIDAHLDHLAKGQLDDGGWTFNFPSWTPAQELDWRGYVTADALRVLKLNGRI